MASISPIGYPCHAPLSLGLHFSPAGPVRLWGVAGVLSTSVQVYNILVHTYTTRTSLAPKWKQEANCGSQPPIGRYLRYPSLIFIRQHMLEMTAPPCSAKHYKQYYAAEALRLTLPPTPAVCVTAWLPRARSMSASMALALSTPRGVPWGNLYRPSTPLSGSISFPPG